MKNGQSYSRLYLRFVALTLVCSAIPLMLVGWVIYDRYSTFSQLRTVSYLQKRAELNRRIVELFLKERTSEIQLISSSHTLDELKDPEKLKFIFEIMEAQGSYFTDLGVINDRGKHLSYIGPYDLMGNDYSITFWFRELMNRGTGVYVSDMFMGYRKDPHFIIAVLRNEAGKLWILRATMQNEFLSSLVESTQIGKTAEVFLVNQHGFFQTAPRFSGRLMQRTNLPMERFNQESGVVILGPEQSYTSEHSSRQVAAYAWLKEPRWMLVVKQDYAEAFAEVNTAARATLIFLEVSIFAILIVSVLTTRHMIKVIKKRDQETEKLNKQLLQASKMASLGELSAGVAHEINNPLAILLTETQVVRDLVHDTKELESNFKKQLLDSLTQIDGMVDRCNSIIQNLLRFSRRSHSTVQSTDVNACLREVLDLMEKRAQTAGVQLCAQFGSELPEVACNPVELQQVFVNLISNAIAAHEGKASGRVVVSTKLGDNLDSIEINVSDTGSGIPKKHLERIFDPFFTTKPVGKGTGLGLAISYGIVKEMGGEIRVKSEEGQGSEFNVLIPSRSPMTNDKGEGE